MKFRPCIDIHNGKVKQIVGGSLLDQGDQAVETLRQIRKQIILQICIKRTA